MNIPEITELVQKNLKNLIRAKAGSLVLILGPLLVIFLAGLAFDNTNVYSVKIGVYRPDTNNITNVFMEELRQQFKVVEFDTEDRCVEAIKNTETNLCMVFSGNFTVGKPKQNQITFHIDYTRVNLVWTILQAMTEEVQERSLQASQNLTKILVQTLDYAHERIGQERAIVVRLATQNDLVTKNIQELMGELGDIDLTFDENAFPVDNLTSANTQVKQWVDSALELGDKGLSKSISFIDAADALVKSSSASGEVKDQLLANFQKSVDDIKKLQEDMIKTKELTVNSFERFQGQLDGLTTSITDTKTRLQQADTSRQFSLRVLEAIDSLLDQSLLSILEVQQAMNDIDNKISKIEITDPEAISQPIVTAIKPLVQEKSYLNYLFPVLIVLVIMFTALLITPTLIMLDKHSPASFRTYMTPVKDSSYVIANFVTSFILLFVQVIIILAIASVFFKGEIISNAPEAILLLIIINSLFILIGMIMGYIFSSEETATLAGVSLGALLLFLSDVIIPIESMPEFFANIASLNPYVIGSSLLRRSLLYDASLLSLLPDILLMLGYIIAAAFLATGTYMMIRKYSIQQLMKNLTPIFAKVRFRKK